MIINNLDQVKKFAYKLGPALKEGDVINLIGEMGAGKTTLTGFLAEYFSIGDSSSPTFALVNIYEGDKTLYHLDLYRLEDQDEIFDIDYESYFYPADEITIIEWAENASAYLPDNMINIEIIKIDPDRREIIIHEDTPRGREVSEYLSS